MFKLSKNKASVQLKDMSDEKLVLPPPTAEFSLSAISTGTTTNLVQKNATFVIILQKKKFFHSWKKQSGLV